MGYLRGFFTGLKDAVLVQTLPSSRLDEIKERMAAMQRIAKAFPQLRIFLGTSEDIGTNQQALDDFVKMAYGDIKYLLIEYEKVCSVLGEPN